MFSQGDAALFLSENLEIENIKRQVKILASDYMEGRETGHNGQKKAAEYLQFQLQKMGLKPYVQQYAIHEIQAQKIQLTIGGKEFLVGLDFEAAGTFENSTLSDFSIVYLKDLSTKMLQKVDLKNKVVLLSESAYFPDKKPCSLAEKIDALQNSGIKAVLTPETNYYSHFTAWCNEHQPQKLPQDSVDFPVPVLRINGELMDSLLKTIGIFPKMLGKKPKEVDVEIQLKSSMINSTLLAENVMLSFPSLSNLDSLKNTIVVMAHYDHLGKRGNKIYYGADDNASGSASLLELARLFHLANSMGIKTKNQVLFLWLSGEEKGLLGSRYFVQQLKAVQGEKYLAAINVDMIGRVDEKHSTDSNYVYIIGNIYNEQTALIANTKMNEKYIHLNLDYTFNSAEDPNKYFYRSDHYPFYQALGIPTIFYFSGVHEDYHLVSDTEDKLNYSKLEKISKLIFLTTWELANKMEIPSSQIIDK